MSQLRIAPRPPSDWDDEVKALMHASAMGGRVLNIFRTVAHHPKLLKRWLVFGNHVLFKSTLAPRDRELLILRTGWNWDAEYEWGQHVLIGRQAGLSDEEIQRVADGPGAAGWTPHERALLRAADELRHDGRVGDATWAELTAHYNTRQLMDLVFTVGQYTLVSMALKTFGVPLDDWIGGFPKAAKGRRE